MNKVFFSLIWLSTCAVAYWFGLTQNLNKDKTFLQEEVRSQEIANEVSKSKDKATVIIPKEEKEIISNPVVSEIDEPELEIAEISTESSFDRLRSTNPIIRIKAFTEALQNPTEENLAMAVQAFNELPEGPTRFSELRLLAFSWAQINPTAAMEWASGLGGFDKRIGQSSVMDSWARNDSDSAIAWARENFEGGEGTENPYFIGIISGMSENNLIGATELMTELPYGRVRGRAASVLFEETWKRGEGVAMHWAENLPEGSLQNYAYRQIAEKISRDDLGRAVEWVDNMEESEVKAAVSEDVAEKWARDNPIEAAKWVEKMPEGEARSESMEEVVTQWARKDPTAAAEWLNQFPSGELMDEPIQRFVREVVRKDPEIAMTWAEAIVDEERKTRTITEVKKVAERIAKQNEAKENGQALDQPNQGGPNGNRRGPPFSRPQ